ncbi:MAG: hypothetical protein CR967_06075 [Proteobacteria bacterium]|nr:MAG: hypothetical protein CR967_06075 [Pseudomonadota bacterium]
MKDCKEKLAQAQIEIEELSVHVADMLGAALYFAGVKEDKVPNAADAYLDAIDAVYGDEDGEMGFKEIIRVIKYLKENKKDLFE